ncbi:MAG: metalloregulator ArsR/SmtB family transcription factor [Cyanobacteria bacterium J06600_6]
MKNSTSTANTSCCSIFSKAVASEQAQEIAAIFKVLGEPARLQLLSYIASQSDGEACGCDLIEPLGLSQPTVSHHLKVLYQAGLLNKERRGNWIYYLINQERIEMLQTVLAINF